MPLTRLRGLRLALSAIVRQTAQLGRDKNAIDPIEGIETYLSGGTGDTKRHLNKNAIDPIEGIETLLGLRATVAIQTFIRMPLTRLRGLRQFRSLLSLCLLQAYKNAIDPIEGIETRVAVLLQPLC